MKRKIFTAITATIAAVLLAAAFMSAGKALAYFTDYKAAQGSAAVSLKWSTRLNEQAFDDHKDITISNTGSTGAIVRVQIFAGEFAQVSDVTTDDPEGAWVRSGDWWYYNMPLEPGEESGVLHIRWEISDTPDYDFNIIVVHESERIVYQDNSALMTPYGWAQIAYITGEAD